MIEKYKVYFKSLKDEDFSKIDVNEDESKSLDRLDGAIIKFDICYSSFIKNSSNEYDQKHTDLVKVKSKERDELVKKVEKLNMEIKEHGELTLSRKRDTIELLRYVRDRLNGKVNVLCRNKTFYPILQGCFDVLEVVLPYLPGKDLIGRVMLVSKDFMRMVTKRVKISLEIRGCMMSHSKRISSRVRECNVTKLVLECTQDKFTLVGSVLKAARQNLRSLEIQNTTRSESFELDFYASLTESILMCSKLEELSISKIPLPEIKRLATLRKLHTEVYTSRQIENIVSWMNLYHGSIQVINVMGNLDTIKEQYLGMLERAEKLHMPKLTTIGVVLTDYWMIDEQYNRMVDILMYVSSIRDVVVSTKVMHPVTFNVILLRHIRKGIDSVCVKFQDNDTASVVSGNMRTMVMPFCNFGIHTFRPLIRHNLSELKFTGCNAEIFLDLMREVTASKCSFTRLSVGVRFDIGSNDRCINSVVEFIKLNSKHPSEVVVWCELDRDDPGLMRWGHHKTDYKKLFGPLEESRNLKKLTLPDVTVQNAIDALMARRDEK